jgi:Tfp pilus assembly protein PilX
MLNSNVSLGSQRGVVTLVISLVILLLSTFVVFNVSKAIMLEQKISNNDNRAKQAFEAAEAGMNVAMHYLDNNPDVNGDNVLDVNVFALDADGFGTANTETVGGNASVTVTVTGTLLAPIITAVGLSDDRSATRTIRQAMTTIDPVPGRPANPLTTRGSLTIGGSATVINQEGFSTIWSGADVQLGSSSGSSTEVPNIADAGYPTCMDIPLTCETVSTSLNQGVGVDVIENDASLGNLTPDEFFMNFFGMSPEAYRATMVTLDTTNPSQADLAASEVIWIEGNATLGNITVGCTESVSGGNVCPTNKTKPSILIVNGDVTFSGTPQFYGILFVRGDANMSGNTTVYGSAIIEGNATNTTGSLNIWYSGAIVQDTALAGASSASAGTWRDF